MKSHRMIAWTVLAAAMMAGATAAFANDAPDSSPPPASQPAALQPVSTTQPAADDDRVKAAVSSIESAADPSAAVEAYARAQATVPDAVEVQRAYVRRLIAFDLPELAEAQARDLTRRAPDDGMAWAVVAYMSARRGDMVDALEGIVTAAKHAPDDPFVQRTAGQLLAYYDRNSDRVKFGYELTQSIDAVRDALGGKTEYNRAYADAYARNEPAPPKTSEAEGYPPSTTEGYDGGQPRASRYDDGTYYYGGGGGYGYTDPYYVTDPYYPWWPSFWWWGPSFIVVDHDRFHHHHHHDHDFHGFHDKRFDHDRFGHPVNRGDDNRFRSVDGRSNRGGNTADRGDRFRDESAGSVDRGDRFVREGDRGARYMRDDSPPPQARSGGDRFRSSEQSVRDRSATARPSGNVARPPNRSARPPSQASRSSSNSSYRSDASRGTGSRSAGTARGGGGGGGGSGGARGGGGGGSSGRR